MNVLGAVLALSLLVLALWVVAIALTTGFEIWEWWLAHRDRIRANRDRSIRAALKGSAEKDPIREKKDRF